MFQHGTTYHEIKNVVCTKYPHIYNYIVRVNSLKNKNKLIKVLSERKYCFGSKNPNKTYYVIHRNDITVGLFSNILVFLEQINYAILKGYIPVIDMKNYPNAYLFPNEIGKINAWEYYFEQPISSSPNLITKLDEVYDSKNVIINNGEYFGEISFLTPSLLFDKLFVEKWRAIYNKYIHINILTEEYINREYQKIINKNDKVLGVFCRGTDYRKLRAEGHPVQPPINVIIYDINVKIKEWNCNKIFLTTEDKEIHDKLKEVFGERLVSSNREYVSADNLQGSMYCTGRTHNRDNDKYLQGLEYLTDLVILSRCNCIITSITSGSVGSILMSQGFEHEHIYNYGVYHSNDNLMKTDMTSS